MFDYFHHADSTHILIFIIFFLFFHDDSFGDSLLDTLEKIGNFVGVNHPVGDDVSQLLICVFILEKEIVLVGDVEDFCENVDGVDAV